MSGATWRRSEPPLPRHDDTASRRVVWCELPHLGRRPVVALSRNAAIPRLGRTLVAPCTTTIRRLPSEVVLEPATTRSPRRTAINLDSVESASVGVLVEHLGVLSDDRMRQVRTALEVAVDCMA